jgi:tetratricopeptide (TPR) repeat protein
MSGGRKLGKLAVLVGMLLGLWAAAYAQSPSTGKKAPPGKATDFEQVERLLTARREYQLILEGLRAHYIATGDIERARWAEEELIGFHRIPKYAFRLELDVPPPTLQGNNNVPEANELYRRAMLFKDKGSWGNDYVDNQRRAELLLQQMLTNYPQSDKISDAAYQLGDIYESKAYRQHDRAAAYFERCFQWNPKTHFDARVRAAQLYDRYLNERNHAIDIYKEIQARETDPKRIEIATKRLAELSGKK